MTSTTKKGVAGDDALNDVFCLPAERIKITKFAVNLQAILVASPAIGEARA